MERQINLLDIINNGENQYVEFKECKKTFPKDALKTICAFSNSNNGLLILGIREELDSNFIVTGVNNPQKVIDEMFSLLNNPEKINRTLITNENVSIEKIDDKQIIVIEVPKVDYKHKPVFLNKNTQFSYYRQGTGDYQCSIEMVKAMLRDAAPDSFDNTLIENFDINDLDEQTINNYLNRFERLNPEHPFLSLNIEQFLTKINAVRLDRNDKVFRPTLAGLLFFGKHSSIKEYLPHYNIEYIFKDSSTNDSFKDRVIYDGIWGEDNLYNFFFYTIEKMYLTLHESSQISDDSISRQTSSKLRIAIREAFINSLIHNDYLNKSSP